MNNVESAIARSMAAATVPDDRSMTVRIWALFGAALLALVIYVWFQWITGPYFTPVPTGVTEPPMYMKIVLGGNAAILVAGLPFAIWYFWIKPWREERRITLDGMLMLACNLLIFIDPLLNYTNTWCLYNTWLWNMGAWTPHVPGWASPDEPGRMVAEPLVNNFVGYGYGVLLTIMTGCWVMSKIKARWPGISNFRLVGALFVYCYIFDFVMEGLILLPAGFYTYPGAIQSLSMNAGTYYQYPLYEGVMWGGVMTAICCLRYFTDSRGRTVVERGLDSVGGGFIGQQLTRFLALFAAVSACFFFIYMVPAQWLAVNADPWPEDVQKRSYFIGGTCGEGTDRPCPHPDLPIPTKHSGYINNEGRLVLPEGAGIPKTVPLERGVF
jgi:hypothetical protein